MVKVYGVKLKENGGCKHYFSPLDVVAIQFKCCNRFFACYECHQELADHPLKHWDIDEYHTLAILCGRCGEKLTIFQYLSCKFYCPHCQAHFNPGCQNHWSRYFICF